MLTRPRGSLILLVLTLTMALVGLPGAALDRVWAASAPLVPPSTAHAAGVPAGAGRAVAAAKVAAVTYTASTTYSSPAKVGAELTSTTTLTASSALSGAVVYLEIDRGSEVVAKLSYEGQTLSATGKRYTIRTTPAATGTYTTKVMVFTAGWTSLLYSNASTRAVTVGAGTTTPPPPVVTPTAFTARTTYSATPTAGSAVTATSSVAVPSSASNALVYLEARDATGKAVGSQSYSGQNLTPAAAPSFKLTFTPASAGRYTVSVQVYTAGWAKLLYRSDDTGAVEVRAGSGGSPSTSPSPSPSSSSPEPTAPAGPSSTAVWAAGSTFGSAQATPGSPFTISTRLTAPTTTSNLVVHMYVEGGGSSQRFEFTGQTVGPTARTLTSTFTPPVAGTYTVKVGIYSADFKTSYYWTNVAGVFGTPMADTGSGKIFAAGRSPRVLALGDSITYGINGDSSAGTGGYRAPLWKLLGNRGWPVTPVGPQAGPPTDSHHAGYPGWRVRDLANGVPGVSPSAVSMMNAYSPDVVLLHIGTNDFGFRDDMAHAADRADALIDSLVAARPSAHIFVARIIDSYAPVPMPEVGAYNDAVQAHVRSLAATGKRVYWVNVNTAVTKASDLGDGVHPTDATYARMAQVWDVRLAEVNASLG